MQLSGKAIWALKPKEKPYKATAGRRANGYSSQGARARFPEPPINLAAGDAMPEWQLHQGG